MADPFQEESCRGDYFSYQVKCQRVRIVQITLLLHIFTTWIKIEGFNDSSFGIELTLCSYYWHYFSSTHIEGYSSFNLILNLVPPEGCKSCEIPLFLCVLVGWIKIEGMQSTRIYAPQLLLPSYWRPVFSWNRMLS
eukprot:scaffold1031_cov61-Cylindrotheca_fusiformis.AAC.1